MSRSAPPRTRRWWLRGGWSAMVLAMAMLVFPPSTRAITEPEFKAVWLLSLAKIIKWPRAAFASKDAPFVIGVVGRDAAFEAALAVACPAGETVKGHPVTIKLVKPGAGVAGCHLVFVCKGAKRSAGAVISAGRGRPVILIGDFAAFAAGGGHINFTVAGGKVGFEFNAGAARGNGFNIPAKIQSKGTAVP